MRYFCSLVGLLAVALSLQAATVKLDHLKAGSQVFSNVTVVSFSATDLYFSHDKGITNVKLKYLEPEVQKQFHYDPKAASEAERQQAQADSRFQDAVAARVAHPTQSRLTEDQAEKVEERLADPISDRSLIGKPAPTIEVEKWLGERPDLRDKYVLISFWAPWSAASRKWIPQLNVFQKKFPTKLAVVGLSAEPEVEVEALTDPKMEYSLAIDTKARLRSVLGVTSVPQILLMDPKGTVLYQGHPAALTERELQGLLARPE